MSEVVPARIATTINIGSADISSMMVQAHIDGLKKEEATLRAEAAAARGEMDAIHAVIVARFQAALDKKRDVLDPLVTALNALLGAKRRVCVRLCESLTSPRDQWRFWSTYISDFRYSFRPFKETKLKSRWILAYEDSVPEEDSDSEENSDWAEDGFSDDVAEAVQITCRHGDQEKTQRLVISVDKALREQINGMLLRMYTRSKRLEEIQTELKNIPNLERKVRAALTQQILASQPDLMRQVNAALVSSGGTLLLEVQE